MILKKSLIASVKWMMLGPLLLTVSALNAQQKDSTGVHKPAEAVPAQAPVKEDSPLKFNLNQDGSHFFQVTFLNQTWLRYNNSNPGTTVLGQSKDHTFDIGLRRTRIQMFGQITDRAFVYFQYGMNNVNFLWNGQGAGNRIVQAYFHDALCEYRLSSKNQLKIGGGLTVTNGLSRFSQPSVGTIMSLDVPVFAQTTVNATDEFSRKLSVYARGQVWKLDYRFSLSDPFPVTTSGNVPVLGPNSNFSSAQHYLQQQGYVMYQFFDHENHTAPYMTGTYLGNKKIFNIAAGFIFQKNAMWRQAVGQKDTTFQNMFHWAVESFLDMPCNKEKGTAVNAYLGFFQTNYGTNYVRTQAQMNPANGVSLPPTSPYNGSLNGSGNGWTMFGTGKVIYAQFGYLLKRDLLKGQGTLMPYVTYQNNNFDRLKASAQVFDLGCNWLMKGHKAKITLDYQNRPIFKGDNTLGTRKGCFILQYQINI